MTQDEKYKILLPSKKIKNGTDKDINLGVEFSSNKKLIKESEILDNVSQNEIFEEERKRSTKYRISGKIEFLTMETPKKNFEDYIVFYKNSSYYNKYPAIHRLSGLSMSDVVMTNTNNWALLLAYPFSATTFNETSTGITYCRHFKTLTSVNDYDIVKSSIADGIYKNDVYNFFIKKDIDIDNYTDYLGRPLSELNIFLVKLNDSPGLIASSTTSILSSTTISNIPYEYKTNYSSSGVTILSADTLFFDKVNLNENVLYEKINKFSIPYISFSTILGTVANDIDVTYNFTNSANTTSLGNNTSDLSLTSDRLVFSGSSSRYYYSPLSRYYIKKYSSIINFSFTGVSATTAIPSYAIQSENNGVKWKNILDIGIFEDDTNGVNYPFLNGSHYLFFDIKTPLRIDGIYDIKYRLLRDYRNNLKLTGYTTNNNIVGDIQSPNC